MTKIYLAGKIAANDWRHDVIGHGQLRAFYCDTDYPQSWPVITNVIDGLDYVGPYFMGDDHGCSHGPASHGVGAGSEGICGGAYPAPSRLETTERCYAAIRACDIFFAWLGSEGEYGDDPCTAYGTLVEIGYAKALGKTVVVGHPHGHDGQWDACTGGHGCVCGSNDLWFAITSADFVIRKYTPQEALEGCSAIFQRAREAAIIAKLESPLEHAFFAAYQELRPDELTGLTAQHPVRASGKNYRLDFAIPDRRIAFEMDGKTYHDTDKAFNHDRRRDLALELLGWRVHRFDGDLIRADAQNVVRIAAQLAGVVHA